MNKAFKFRLYPNAGQQVLFAKTFGCVRFIYNRMLADKIAYYESMKEKLNNTPAQYKKEFPWLKEVDSLALANAQLNLQTAYNNFFRNPHKIGFPKFKSKKVSHKSYTTNNQKGSITIYDGYIKLPKVGYVKAKIHRNVPDNWKVKSATISMTPTGKYFASILSEYETEIQPIKAEKVIGLDYSMRKLFVDSEGRSADYPRFYRQALGKLAKEQRKLSHCQNGSRNRDKQRKRVALLHERVANQRKDFLHKLSRQIANDWDAVCMENLDMKAMTQEHNFGKSVSDNGWGMFTEFLNYKLSDQGKQLVRVNKWFPSSKTCSRCRAVKEELLLSERTYCCECGFTLDRDWNAAINIKNEGLRLFA